jgi:tRNA G18 (ribose-2'-O)-methylase SpoU
MSSAKKIKTKYLVKGKLLKFTGQRPCQNVVLKVDKLAHNEIRSIRDVLDVDAKPEGKGRLILFLDQVTDPQNFGSILRSAMFLGVDTVIVNKLNACGLTPAVSKVSSGALEFMPVHQVKFVSKFFIEAKNLGF